MGSQETCLSSIRGRTSPANRRNRDWEGRQSAPLAVCCRLNVEQSSTDRHLTKRITPPADGANPAGVAGPPSDGRTESRISEGRAGINITRRTERQPGICLHRSIQMAEVIAGGTPQQQKVVMNVLFAVPSVIYNTAVLWYTSTGCK